jgi:hypothetical protein
MKVGEFQKAINVTSKSYSTFMTQNGPFKGSGSSVYYSAWAFFQKREMCGLKMPKKKVKTDAAGGDQSVNISGVVLPGEADDVVEVYGMSEWCLVFETYHLLIRQQTPAMKSDARSALICRNRVSLRPNFFAMWLPNTTRRRRKYSLNSSTTSAPKKVPTQATRLAFSMEPMFSLRSFAFRKASRSPRSGRRWSRCGAPQEVWTRTGSVIEYGLM